MLANLESLVDLGRRDGVDIRPTLLRVLTDIYVQKPKHASEEERQYTELALRLLETVDTATKLTTATTLARYREAPLPILRRLVRDSIEVAEPIFRHCELLPAAELRQIAKDIGSDYGRMVGVAGAAGAAQRAGAPRPALVDHQAGGPRSAETRATGGELGAAAELCELFFAASAAERRIILLNLEYVAPDVLGSATPLDGLEACRRLEAAALQRKRIEFARELAPSLRLSIEQARRITDDNSGEPLVVAAKALGMAADVLQRILLFLNPAIGHSVRRIYDLAQLFQELTPGIALHLVAIWREAAPEQRGFSTHRPVLYNDEAARSPRAASVNAGRAAPSAGDRKRLGIAD